MLPSILPSAVRSPPTVPTVRSPVRPLSPTLMSDVFAASRLPLKPSIVVVLLSVSTFTVPFGAIVVPFALPSSSRAELRLESATVARLFSPRFSEPLVVPRSRLPALAMSNVPLPVILAVPPTSVAETVPPPRLPTVISPPTVVAETLPFAFATPRSPPIVPFAVTSPFAVAMLRSPLTLATSTLPALSTTVMLPSTSPPSATSFASISVMSPVIFDFSDEASFPSTLPTVRLPVRPLSPTLMSVVVPAERLPSKPSIVVSLSSVPTFTLPPALMFVPIALPSSSVIELMFEESESVSLLSAIVSLPPALPSVSPPAFAMSNLASSPLIVAVPSTLPTLMVEPLAPIVISLPTVSTFTRPSEFAISKLPPIPPSTFIEPPAEPILTSPATPFLMSTLPNTLSIARLPFAASPFAAIPPLISTLPTVPSVTSPAIAFSSERKLPAGLPSASLTFLMSMLPV